MIYKSLQFGFFSSFTCYIKCAKVFYAALFDLFRKGGNDWKFTYRKHRKMGLCLKHLWKSAHIYIWAITVGSSSKTAKDSGAIFWYKKDIYDQAKIVNTRSKSFLMQPEVKQATC